MGTINDLNYLRRIMYHPCKLPSPEIMIEAALGVGAVELAQFFIPDCNDILRETFKDRVHERIGQANKFTRPGHRRINVNPRRIIPKDVAGAWAVWQVLKPIEAGLNKLFIFSLAVQGITNWTSLMYTIGDCDLPASGFHTVTVNPFIYTNKGANALLFNGTWVGSCARAAGSSVFVRSGCYAAITVTGNISNWMGIGSNSATLVISPRGAGPGAQSSKIEPAGSDNSAIMVGLNHASNTGIFEQEYNIHIDLAHDAPGAIFLSGCQVTITSFGHSWAPNPTGCFQKIIHDF